MTLRSIVCAALLSSAGACAPIEAARRAQDPASASPGERTVRAEEVGLGPGSVLTLERAVEIALSSHPSVALARARADAAETRVREAAAGYLPQLDLSGSFDAGKSWADSPGEDSSNKSFRASLGISQLLFDFGKTPALARQAAEEHLAALSDLRASRVDAVFNVRQAFYNVLKQQELLRVGEETVRQFQKRLERVEGFVAVGSRVRYDLTKAQVVVLLVARGTPKRS
ncbi:MAG: TolC family protein [Planctomycetes bacterium]|nr:TolC family protein [Planctomycetota bacterium]